MEEAPQITGPILRQLRERLDFTEEEFGIALGYWGDAAKEVRRLESGEEVRRLESGEAPFPPARIEALKHLFWSYRMEAPFPEMNGKKILLQPSGQPAVHELRARLWGPEDKKIFSLAFETAPFPTHQPSVFQFQIIFLTREEILSIKQVEHPDYSFVLSAPRFEAILFPRARLF